ncbi:diguanylate cyclase [Desulfosporosinus sp. FKB]|uniref:sensor domain-containing diguanylate cyclase/phosphohydrolase n=1 Tax=Desulfosporosinus sp. FKB TaxID=1969835 RepID=UPI000B4A02A6|nr:diguanylate cyclase [Desulfosporosinus sp. FKB]
MKDHKTFNNIFEEEMAVYQEAREFLKKGNLKFSDLMVKFDSLINQYCRLINITRRLCSISDVQSRDLKRKEREIQNILDHSDQGFLTFGKDLLIHKEHSSECIRIFGRKVVHKNILDLLRSENEDQNRLIADVLHKVFDLPPGEVQLSYINELPNLLKIQGNYINIKYKMISDDLDHQNQTLMVVLTDITEKRKTADQVLFLSYHDKQTSLYNRAYVESIIPQLQIESNLPLSIVMADLNTLKLVNDVFGHETGDKLIVNAAKIFLSCCRKSDIVARWGGDEFIMILPGANQEVCTRICNNIKSMFKTLPADPVDQSASLGSVTLNNWETDIISLIGVADRVMYNNKLIERKKTREMFVSSVEKVLEIKCPSYLEHNARVEALARSFVKLPGVELNSQEMDQLISLARFHDIGKVAIPSELLKKNTSLTEDEFKIIRQYPEVGYRMAHSMGEPLLAQSILALREFWNGKGYPHGLKGEQIPQSSRIISILDVYDVITHDQPYRSKKTNEEACQELQRGAGAQFDPQLTNLFVNNLPSLLS